MRAAKALSKSFIEECWTAAAGPIELVVQDYAKISNCMMDGTDWKDGVTSFEIDDYIKHACETAFKQKAISAKIKLGKEELDRKLAEAEDMAAELGKG